MRHKLPSDPGIGEDSWFYRLNRFQRQETKRQAEYKRRNWPTLDDGVWSKNRDYSYPHILPDGYIEYNFAPGLLPYLKAYLDSCDIQLHSEILNLKSSQACCWNFFFSLRQDLDLASRALRFLLTGVKEVLDIEFEYTGPDSTTGWLGEPPSGKRGQNRTSADATVWWTDNLGQNNLTVVEWKYTEAEFGNCGGYNSNRNLRKDKCRNLHVGNMRPNQDCYLARGNSLKCNRRYWEHLESAGISLSSFTGKAGCPFIGPFYQLMRLQLLAAYTKSHDKNLDRAEVTVICFKDNIELLEIPSNLAWLAVNIPEAWRKLLADEGSLRTVFIEDIVRDAYKHTKLKESAWMQYFIERYGLEGK